MQHRIRRALPCFLLAWLAASPAAVQPATAQSASASAPEADVSAAPLNELARLPLHYVNTVTSDGGLAYVGRGDGGMGIVDLSDPAAPSLRGEILFPAEMPAEFMNGDGGAYLRNPEQGFGSALAVRWPAQPDATQTAVYNQLAFVQEIAVDGQFAYVVATGPGDGGLWVVNVSDPYHPRQAAFVQLRLPPGVAREMTAMPTEQSYSETVHVRPQGIVKLGQRVYVATNVGILGVDVTDPAAPQLLSAEPLWSGHPAAVTGDDGQLIVVGTDGSRNGLWVLNAAFAGPLAEQDFVSLAEDTRFISARAVAGRDGVYAVADGDAGVALVRPAESTASARLIRYPVPEQSVDVAWSDDGLLYVAQTHDIGGPGDAYPEYADRLRGVRVIDPSRPVDGSAGPWTVAFQPLAERVFGLDVAGGRVDVANSMDGLRILAVHPQAAVAPATAPRVALNDSVPPETAVPVADAASSGAGPLVPIGAVAVLGLAAASVWAFRRTRRTT